MIHRFLTIELPVTLLATALLTISATIVSATALAQDYPYSATDDSGPESLPVENPEAPEQDVPNVRKSSKPTSLFRMGLKLGGNFSIFQDRLCVSADPTAGCLAYTNRSFNGIGYEGRIAFGWDLAYQPIYVETEIGYQGKLVTLSSPLRNLLISQGIYHRERIGKKSMWKNGVVVQLDGRIAENSEEELSFAAYPALGLSTMVESGWFIGQAIFYLHQFRTKRNYFSISTLMGIRF